MESLNFLEMLVFLWKRIDFDTRPTTFGKLKNRCNCVFFKLLRGRTWYFNKRLQRSSFAKLKILNFYIFSWLKNIFASSSLDFSLRQGLPAKLNFDIFFFNIRFFGNFCKPSPWVLAKFCFFDLTCSTYLCSCMYKYEKTIMLLTVREIIQ